MYVNGGLSGQQTVAMDKWEIKSLTQRPINGAFERKKNDIQGPSEAPVWMEGAEEEKV